jgi:hypothetical protein
MSNKKKFDIFLSYQWDIKNDVRQLYTKLTEELNYKVWMDEHELKGGTNLYDQITKGLNDTVCLIALVTKKYSKSENCKLEIEYAQSNNIPMIVLMMERIEIKDLGSVGLVINRKTRLNFYKEADKTKLWTGELFDSLLKSVEEFKPKRKSFLKSKHGKCVII